MSAGMIKLDSTRHSVVVTCGACSWRTLVHDRAAGWAAGARHQSTAHGTDGNAARASWAAANRAGAPR